MTNATQLFAAALFTTCVAAPALADDYVCDPRASDERCELRLADVVDEQTLAEILSQRDVQKIANSTRVDLESVAVVGLHDAGENTVVALDAGVGEQVLLILQQQNSALPLLAQSNGGEDGSIGHVTLTDAEGNRLASMDLELGDQDSRRPNFFQRFLIVMALRLADLIGLIP